MKPSRRLRTNPSARKLLHKFKSSSLDASGQDNGNGGQEPNNNTGISNGSYFHSSTSHFNGYSNDTMENNAGAFSVPVNDGVMNGKHWGEQVIKLLMLSPEERKLLFEKHLMTSGCNHHFSLYNIKSTIYTIPNKLVFVQNVHHLHHHDSENIKPLFFFSLKIEATTE